MGDRYYAHVPGPWVVLEVDTAGLLEQLRYDDAAERYPHLYAPLPLASVRRVHSIDRSEDGYFIALADARPWDGSSSGDEEQT